MALVHKAADEIIIFFKSFGENEINELVVTRNKLKWFYRQSLLRRIKVLTSAAKSIMSSR